MPYHNLCNCHSCLLDVLSVHPPSVGRFVTRRRRGAAAKSKLPKAIISILSSSDDFTSGGGGLLQSSRRRRRKRRRLPPPLLLSSVEKSLNAAGAASFTANPLREVSLNELSDHSLGACPRKPIFCSTPSVGPFSKRPRLKLFPINKSSTSPSMSLSCIGPIGHLSTDKLQSSLGEQEPGLHHHEEPSGDLFLKPEVSNWRSSCSEEARSHSQDSKTKSGGKLPSLNLLSTDADSSSDFVSAAGGLEWLIEALKEKCLTELCTVQLQRLDSLAVTQLCSQTTYSSCLGLSSSFHSQQADQRPLSVDSSQTADLLPSSDPSLHLCLSVTSNKTQDHSQSTNTDQAVSVSDGSPSSASVLYDEPTWHTQTPASDPVHTLFAEKAAAIKDKCLVEKCTVQLEKLPLTAQQLRGFTKEKNARKTCGGRSVSSHAGKSESEHTRSVDSREDLACSRETTEGMMLSVRSVSSSSSSSAASQTQFSDPETEGKAAVLTMMLKEKCLSAQPRVEMQRLTSSQLKEILQLQVKRLESPMLVSDSASDESDTTHCAGETSVTVHMKKRRSASCEDKMTSDKEEVVRSSCGFPSKRKKMSLAPKDRKRRSSSSERPGTTRKACVSGLSVSRWKNTSNASRCGWAGRTKAVDCSINELISTQPKQPKVTTQHDTAPPLSFTTTTKVCFVFFFHPGAGAWNNHELLHPSESESAQPLVPVG